MKEVLLNNGCLPILNWAKNPEEGAINQAKNVASHPCVVQDVVLCPDCHAGYGVYKNDTHFSPVPYNPEHISPKRNDWSWHFHYLACKNTAHPLIQPSVYNDMRNPGYSNSPLQNG